MKVSFLHDPPFGYDAVNGVYGEYLSDPYPARSAVEVRDLPIDIEVEIEAVATLGSE